MDIYDLLVDLHKDGERQGPGSEAMTKRAQQFLMWKITACRSNHKLHNPEGYCIAPFQGL